MRELVPKATVVALQVDLMAAFADFLRLDVAQGDASPATIRTYYGQVQRFVEWCESQGIGPANATIEDVKQYRASLIEQGYARATIASRLNTLRRFFDMAVGNGLRPDNPVVGVKAPPDRTAQSEQVKWLPLTAIQQILRAPDNQTPIGIRDRAILALLALHGLRVMEVVTLDAGDVDLEAGIVSVMGKGKKRRVILLVPQSQAIIEKWGVERAEFTAMGETAFFVSLHHPEPGTRISRRGVRKRVDYYLQDLGLKREGISCHALRHSFATLARAAGAELDAISQSLGHASVVTTQVYSDIVDKARHNPARFLLGALEELE